MSDFYEFEHECGAMPAGARFFKMSGYEKSQFTADGCERVHYGFRFCPYCGEDMEGGRDDDEI